MAVVSSSSLGAIPIKRPSDGDVWMTLISAVAVSTSDRCAIPFSDVADLEAAPC